LTGGRRRGWPEAAGSSLDERDQSRQCGLYRTDKGC
jgi:hypothetical protein